MEGLRCAKPVGPVEISPFSLPSPLMCRLLHQVGRAMAVLPSSLGDALGCGDPPYGAGILHLARLSLLLHRGPHPTLLSGAIAVSPLPPSPRGWCRGHRGRRCPAFP